MKKLKFLLAALLTLMCANVWAQESSRNYTVYTEGVEVGERTSVCLYNIGAHRFLTDGMDWGTHATVDNAGRIVDLKPDAGKFSIRTYSYSNADKAGYMTSNGYLDTGSPDYWTFETASVDGYTNVYKIKLSDTQYLTYSSSDQRVNVSEPTNSDADCWIIVPLSERIARGDYTFLIQNSEFNRLWERREVWKEANGVNGAGGIGSKTYCGEFWNRTFNMYQEFSNVTNGTYRMKVQGFYRVGNGANDAAAAAAARNEGHEVINAYFYANDVKVAFPSIFDNDCHENLGGDYVSGSQVYTIGDQTCYIPSDMNRASSWFYDGAYETSLEVNVTNGNLTIGAKNEVDDGGQWAIFDNFRLEYLGFKGNILQPVYDKLYVKLDASSQTAFAEDWTTISATYYSSEKEAMAALTDSYMKYVSAPAEVTDLIIDANFDLSNPEAVAGSRRWVAEGCSPQFNGGLASNRCAEVWNHTFDVYQKIDNLRNGFYRMNVQGFYRVGRNGEAGGNDPSQAAIARSNDEEVINAYFYANDVTVPFPSIFDNNCTENRGGSYVSSTGYDIKGTTYYVPTNMDRASAWFSENVYETSLIVEVTDGTLKIGARNNVDNPDQWAIFDNFRLTYLGNAAAGMKITDAEYSTFCAPFAVTLPAGVSAYTVESVTDNQLQLTPVETAIPANTPVVLQCENLVDETFYGDNATGTPEAGLLTGVYDATTAPVGSYVLVKRDGKALFVVVDATPATVPANRAYLTLSSSDIKEFSLGEATGIDELKDEVKITEGIFNLAGQAVGRDYKGIVIMNGKKVYQR